MNNDETQNENLENESLTFTVSSDKANTRLDAFLASQISDWSRSRLQKLIEDGDCLVNGKTSKPSYKLREGDEIEIELVRADYENFTPENIPLNIVYEDDAIIVINKPAGMIVHPGAGVTSGTLANAIAFHCGLRIADCGMKNPANESIFQDSEKDNQIEQSAIRNPQSAIEKSAIVRPGIVHRLDKDTSGLIVVAKNETAHEKLSEQFRERKVFKTYTALVHGVVKNDKGKIEEPIARDPRNRTRMATVRGGRPALSIYKIKRSFERFTLLDVEIKTGRTHQIRVHLAFLNHPVVGDETYNGGRDKTAADVKVRSAIAKLNRVFLHAATLGFYHPVTNEWMKFNVEMPDELNELLEVLK